MAVPAASATTPPSRRLTFVETQRMAEAGVIAPEERLELVDGVLVEMSPEGADHFHVTSTLLTRLARTYPESYTIASQATLPIGSHAFLEPDVFVIDDASRQEIWPAPADVILVVEVSRTSVDWDRGGKALLYARWGAGTYWVVDLTAGEVAVHTEPEPDGYRAVRIHRGDESVSLPALGTSISVCEILRQG